MRRGLHNLFLILLILPFFTACEKGDVPIILPPPGSALQQAVDMGEQYDTQLYFDFETGQVVKTSPVDLWDLAFESTPDGYHIFINGGKNVFIYNTHTTDLAAPLTVTGIAKTDWVSDAPCGLPDSTAIGEWQDGNGITKGEVYIVKITESNYKKILLKGLDADGYRLAYGDLNETMPDELVIPKDGQFTQTYFSFSNGGAIVQPEPLKTAWDIVFTKYRYRYPHLNNFPYLVCGVLLNPYETMGKDDSTSGFSTIAYDQLQTATTAFTNHRDVIGFDWKHYDFTAEKYVVDTAKCYVIRNSSGAYWKIDFLNFYNAQGVKGAPSFRYERIQ